MSDFFAAKEKILKIIEEKKITPLPKWYFLLKNYLCWTMFVISGIIVAFSAAMAGFLISNEWQIYGYLDENFLRFFLLSAPYFWLVAAAFFLLFLHYIFRKTKEGYKYEIYKAMGVSAAAVLALSLAVFYSGLSSSMHKYILSFSFNRPSFYSNIICGEIKTWSNPEAGFLGGQILETRDEKNFTIRDFKNRTWRINGNSAKVLGNFFINEGKKVKILGRKEGGNIFFAKAIKQW